MPRMNGFLALLVAVLLAFSGCAGQSDAPPAATSPTPTATDETGSISGSVLDPELRPVPGVQVAVLDEDLTITTDSEGSFVFNDLAPGSYRLAAQKLGYDAAASAVTVTAGQVTEVTLSMEPIEVLPDPFIDVLPFEGYIQCGVNPFLPVNVCSEATGADTNRFHFEIPTTVPLAEIVVELVWTPATAGTGQHLELDLCDQEPEDTNQVLCESNEHYWEYDSGPSPLVLRETELPLDQAVKYEVTVGAGLPDESDPTSLAPVVQQPFAVYVSLCYVSACGDAYTAVDQP